MKLSDAPGTPPRGRSPLWTLTEATLRGGARPRLERISLEIPVGRTAILGHSGAGKTSLLNLLVGFERPSAGRVEVHRPATDRLPLFWVPENDGLWPHLTASEHLRAVSPDPRHGDQLLSAFDLEALSQVRPERMSRGERSRLAVARALGSGAAVLVMDEPLAHVDPARIGRYWDVLRSHCAAHQVSLVFATHTPEATLAEADYVVCLHDGRVLFTGSVQELYQNPPSAALAAFLGPANWYEPGEAGGWLDDPQPGRRCYRPEQIRVLPDAAGRHVVSSTRFCGSYEIVDMSDTAAGAATRLYHRPAREQLRPGDRVCVRVADSSQDDLAPTERRPQPTA